jgi:hypothetical protein
MSRGGIQKRRGNIDTAAHILGLPKRTTQSEALIGEIPGASKLFGRWTFDVQELHDLVKDGEKRCREKPTRLRGRTGATKYCG